MKRMYLQKEKFIDGQKLHYYEIGSEGEPLIMIHAQGVDALSYENVWKPLSKSYHIYAVDCPGHGGSTHDSAIYTLKAIGDKMIKFIRELGLSSVTLTGHSSGGLIAAYIAANSDLCKKLILEDPPFFACEGDRRKNTFNYRDLSTVCHNYLAEGGSGDFILYYFTNQKAWDLFPDKSRDKVKAALVARAKKYREKHPDRTLKVPFWPKAALLAYRGMQNYDPKFGEAFYLDTFNEGVDHAQMLSRITCETIYLKAKTVVGSDGTLQAANSEEDAARVQMLIQNCRTIKLDCGHGVHIERKKDFLACFS